MMVNEMFSDEIGGVDNGEGGKITDFKITFATAQSCFKIRRTIDNNPKVTLSQDP